jgi:hypothetical protein
LAAIKARLEAERAARGAVGAGTSGLAAPTNGGGTRAVPAVVGRGRTRISQVGVLRPMPLPTAPRVVCMLSDVELSLDGAAGFHDADRAFEAR